MNINGREFRENHCFNLRVNTFYLILVRYVGLRNGVISLEGYQMELSKKDNKNNKKEWIYSTYVIYTANNSAKPIVEASKKMD